MNPTNKLAYIRHKYSGPRKSRKKVQAAFKRHHGSDLYRVEAWRNKKQKVVEETADCPVVFSPHTTQDHHQLSNLSTAEEMAPADQADIKFCRVCLAVDVKLYEMKDFQLRKMFHNITGIPVCDETERVLHRVCWECAARLTAASAFRDKALLTDTLLKDLVHRNKRNVEKLRRNYSHLKSPLTVQRVFISADINFEDTPIELHNDETENRTKRESNEEEEGSVFDEEEPLIEFPVKTEIESDPFAENDINIQIKDENSLTLSEESNLDDSFTSSKHDYDDDIKNTEEHMNEKSEDIEMIDTPIKYVIDLVEDNAEEQPTIAAINVFDEPSTEITIGLSDRAIVLEKDNEEGNPILGGIGNVSSSKQDAQSLVEPVSVKKAKQQTKRKTSERLKEDEIQTMIALNEKGVPEREIAEKIGKLVTTVRFWLKRYRETGEMKYKRAGRTPIAYRDRSNERENNRLHKHYSRLQKKNQKFNDV